MTVDQLLRAELQAQPYPLLFATISGAHLYGFPSPDSDYDLRGCHLLPAREVVGLNLGPETIEASNVRDGLLIDFVSHDAGKFFGLLLKRNGYVLEQLYSPLVIQTTPEHAELKALARGCVTRYHAHHYLGFAQTQWRLFNKEEPRRVKPLLYTYRVLLTGLHLMRSGEIEANLELLNAEWHLPLVDELIARKRSGGEGVTIDGTDLLDHERQYNRLVQELEVARDSSQLPDAPSSRAGLHDLLVRLRLSGVATAP